MNDGFLGILRLVSVAIQNVGFAVVVGALLSSQWLARGESTWQQRVGRRLVVTLRAASIVSLLASALSFWAHCALMSESTLSRPGRPCGRCLREPVLDMHGWLARFSRFA
jgi:putative copper resistance protein D